MPEGKSRHPDAPDTVENSCPDCGGTMDHDGEEPVTATTGAYGKYVAAIYKCRDCGTRTEGHPENGKYSA